ncbi:MAG: protein translocase subunit SecD [Planctomycetota bacterium]|jgi:protein-export membrane protein SecD/preprotein translocase SecF subunit
MSTVGRNQLLGFALFVVTAGALTGLLFYRKNCHEIQERIGAQVAAKEGELKAADAKYRADVRDVMVDSDRHQQATAAFGATKKKLDGEIAALKTQKEDAAPKLPWLGWPLGILPVLAFLVAVNLTTEHGKKFVITLAVAGTALGIFYFRDPSMGIDLAGGAELRYRMQTDVLDARIKQHQIWLDDLLAGGAAAENVKKEVKGRIAGLEKQLADATGVSKEIIAGQIAELKEVLDPEKEYASLADMIAMDTQVRDQSVTMAVTVIRKRIDAAGLRQITVRSTDNGRGLLVQIPTQAVAADPNMKEDERRERERAALAAALAEVKKYVSTPGLLGLHHVDACNAYQHDRERWEKAQRLWTKKPEPQEVLPGYWMVKYAYEEKKKKKSEPLLLRRKPVVTGDYLSRALVGRGEEGLEVQVWLKPAGGEKMERFTDENNTVYSIKHDQDRLAVVLDSVVKTAPVVKTRLGSFFRITGRFTHAEADGICRVLNAGSLKYTPKLLSENQVGPGLGQDSIDAGTRASLIGAGLVILFMALYYLGAGLIADFALVLNLAIILGAMNALGGTFTLPGIAGIALTIGMAVDANVLIFERIREEKLRGKPLKLAVKTGHDRALVTILDANITTLITAFILYGFGTGAVKGFAVTLSLGIMASLFTALFVTRGFLEFAVDKGWAKELKMLRLVGETKIPFMKLRPVLGTFSALLVIGALVLVVPTACNLMGVFRGLGSRADRYVGLDFSGGMEVQVKFREGNSKAAADVREMAEKARQAMQEAADATAAGAEMTPVAVPAFSVQSFNPSLDGTSREFKIFCQLSDEMMDLIEGRTPGGAQPGAAAETGAPLAAAGSRTVTGFFEEAFGKEQLDPKEPFPGVSRIGRRVAGELARKALGALVFSVIFIFFYIVIRFDFVVGFGLGAAAALVHDAVIAMGALLLANHLGMAGARIDLVIIAAVLTIIGYSLNDTIVVFDRIRENRAAQRSLSLRDLVDMSVNQTLSRTLLTSVTTLLAVVSILVLGGGTLRPFALVFTVGVVVGTYSSVFVASAVAVAWESWRDKRKEAAKKRLRSAPQGAR